MTKKKPCIPNDKTMPRAGQLARKYCWFLLHTGLVTETQLSDGIALFNYVALHTYTHFHTLSTLAHEEGDTNQKVLTILGQQQSHTFPVAVPKLVDGSSSQVRILLQQKRTAESYVPGVSYSQLAGMGGRRRTQQNLEQRKRIPNLKLRAITKIRTSTVLFSQTSKR